MRLGGRRPFRSSPPLDAAQTLNAEGYGCVDALFEISTFLWNFEKIRLTVSSFIPSKLPISLRVMQRTELRRRVAERATAVRQVDEGRRRPVARRPCCPATASCAARARSHVKTSGLPCAACCPPRGRGTDRAHGGEIAFLHVTSSKTASTLPSVIARLSAAWSFSFWSA